MPVEGLDAQPTTALRGSLEPETKEEAMLRTASTRTNPRSAPRQTTGVRQERMLDSTPVLFRLPTIDVAPVVTPEGTNIDDAAAQRATIAFAEAVVGTTPKPQGYSETTVQPTMLQSTTVQQTSMQPAMVQPSVAEPAAQPASPQLVAGSEYRERRSWWEHWSSGVVLIVLILALLVVSILALKRPATPTSEMIAEQQTEPKELVIPQLDPAPPTNSTARGNATEGASSSEENHASFVEETADDSRVSSTQSPSRSAQRTSATQNPVANATTQAGPSSLGTATLAAEPTSLTSLVPGELALTLPNSSNTATATKPEGTASSVSLDHQGSPLSLDMDYSSSSPTADVKSGLAASASLSTPIGVEPPSLFSEAELGFGESIPVSPVSNQTVPPMVETNEKPSPRDGASVGSTPAGVNPTNTGAAQSDGGVPVQLVATSDQAYNPVSPGLSQPMQNVSQTAYPDLPADAIIRAWQMSKELNQAQSGQSNRYALPPSNTGAAVGTESAVPPASGLLPGTPAQQLPNTGYLPTNSLNPNTLIPSSGASAPGAAPYYPPLPNL